LITSFGWSQQWFLMGSRGKSQCHGPLVSLAGGNRQRRNEWVELAIEGPLRAPSCQPLGYFLGAALRSTTDWAVRDWIRMVTPHGLNIQDTPFLHGKVSTHPTARWRGAEWQRQSGASTGGGGGRVCAVGGGLVCDNSDNAGGVLVNADADNGMVGERTSGSSGRPRPCAQGRGRRARPASSSVCRAHRCPTSSSLWRRFCETQQWLVQPRSRAM